MDFCSSRKTKLREETQQLKNAELAQKARFEIDYEEYRTAEIERVAALLPPAEYQRIFDEQRRINRSVFKSMTTEQLDDLTHRTVRGELENSGRVRLMSLDKFIASRSVPV